jgi:hypothetical protein
MCVQVTKTANRFEISSLLENILLKQVRWCLTFVGLYILKLMNGKLDIYLKLIYVNMNILKCLYVNWSPHFMSDHEDI